MCAYVLGYASRQQHLVTLAPDPAPRYEQCRSPRLHCRGNLTCWHAGCSFFDFDSNVLSKVGRAQLSIVNSTFGSTAPQGLGPDTVVLADTSDDEQGSSSRTSTAARAAFHIQSSQFADQGIVAATPRFLTEHNASAPLLYGPEGVYEVCRVPEDCSVCRVEGVECTQEATAALSENVNNGGIAVFLSMTDEWIVASQQVCFNSDC